MVKVKYMVRTYLAQVIENVLIVASRLIHQSLFNCVCSSIDSGN